MTATRFRRHASDDAVPPSPLEDTRILAEADCQEIAQRLVRVTQGGGATTARIWSDWVGSVRWGRNQIADASEMSENSVAVQRVIRGAYNGWVMINETTDEALVAAARRAERMVETEDEHMNADLQLSETLEPAAQPPLFDTATYQLDTEHRVAAAAQLAQTAATAGLLSAGYLEVSAHSMAVLDSVGRTRYFKYTWAQCSVTVRDPAGKGSGWAGVDWPAWGRIDPQHLVQVAIDKCLKSRHPVAVEPGRYTTILEPQAVFDLVSVLFGERGISGLGRAYNEADRGPHGRFWKSKETDDPYMPGLSMLGDRIIDERLTISADPMDPDLGFPPFRIQGEWGDQSVYHPWTMIKHGVLTALPYDRTYAGTTLGTTTGLPHSGVFRMSGGETSLAEMIASTKRGIVVTRFNDVSVMEETSVLVRGYTRDGLWLVENGAITKAITNMVATESVLFVLNNVDQLGPPQRIFNPPVQWMAYWGAETPAPAIVPAMKVRDFSFTALADAV